MTSWRMDRVRFAALALAAGMYAACGGSTEEEATPPVDVGDVGGDVSVDDVAEDSADDTARPDATAPDVEVPDGVEPDSDVPTEDVTADVDVDVDVDVDADDVTDDVADAELVALPTSGGVVAGASIASSSRWRVVTRTGVGAHGARSARFQNQTTTTRPAPAAAAP